MVLKQGGVDFDGIMDPLVEGFSALAAKGGPDVRLLIDVSRSFGRDNAARNLSYLLGYISKRPSDRIIGIGLGGQEIGNPCIAYKDVFAAAREAGLHTVAHAGEEVGPESIRDAVVELGAERIGHGTSAIQDPSLMDLLREQGHSTRDLPDQQRRHGQVRAPLRGPPDQGVPRARHPRHPEHRRPRPLRRGAERGIRPRGRERSAWARKASSTLLRNGIRATFMSEEGKAAALADLEAALQAALGAEAAPKG